MNEELQPVFHLDHIFKICVEKNQPGDAHLGILVNASSYADSWNAFYKWVKGQLDLGRTVNVPNFGNLSIRQIDEKEHYVHINLSEGFLNQHNLDFKSALQEIKQPTIKLNLGVTAKQADNLDPQIVGTALNRILSTVGEILSNYNNVEVNLGHMGKLVGVNRAVAFSPALKSKGGTVQHKQTVKALLEANITGKIVTKRDDRDNVLEQNGKRGSKRDESNGEDLTAQRTDKNIGLSPIRKVEDGYDRKFGANGSFLSPQKRYPKSDNFQELLGAGTDPLAKNQEFSHLTTKPTQLMNAKFVKPGHAQYRYPPVIDVFARTIAAPISHTKFSFSVGGRIGSNYTPTTKYLHLEYDSKVIKYIKPKESKIQLTAEPEFLEDPASEDEELFYILNPDKQSQSLAKKVGARLTSFKRYMKYILSEIPIDCIAPIRQYWINDVLDLIPAEYPYLDRITVETLIDNMLNEINKDYYDSIRKSILDYVLKEEDERLRVGITQILNPPLDYGENIYMGLEPNDEWKEFVHMAKAEISDRLVICSNSTLKFKRIWSEYEPKPRHFMLLPGKEDPPLYIEDFTKIQNNKLAEVKTELTTNWLKRVEEIYREEIREMNKKQAFIFFESNAALMANQLRSLITESILEYRDFFMRFKKPTQDDYKKPFTIIKEEKDYKNEIEDVFLVVKIICEEKPVNFQNQLQNVKLELLKLIENIVDVSKGFPRAEKDIARSEKTSLWHVTLEDEVIQNAFKDIETTIKENMEAISHVPEVFDKYIFLLREHEQVERFISQEKHTRKEFQNEIAKYEQIYKNLNKEIPFYIRTSMILIDCTEFKRALLKACQDLIKKLIKAIHDYILDQNAVISKEFERMMDDISHNAENAEKLVELENHLEKIKRVKAKETEAQFNDLKDWLMILFLTNFKITVEDLNKINLTSERVKSILDQANNREDRLHKEREDIENGLRKRRGLLTEEIDFVASQIDKLKDFGYLAFENANAQVESLNKRIRACQENLLDINTKEELIGWQPTEFPKLQEIIVSIKPYESLWKTVKDFENKSNSWKKDNIFNLDPEVVEKESKTMFMNANKLVNDLSNRKAGAGITKVANSVLENIKEFNQNVPLVRALVNPGLNKPYYWEQISNLEGFKSNNFEINRDRAIPFSKIVEMDALVYIRELEEISDFASKEYSNEKILEKMKSDWSETICEMKPWKETGTFAVSGNTIDEAQQVLDDQMIKTQTMKGSPYAKRFEAEIIEWEEWLKYTQDVFEYWVKVQSVWLYLEPVFASEDIMTRLKVEGPKFKEVDANWRFSMSKIVASPKVVEVMKNKKLLDNFKTMHNTLDEVQKGLNDFLDSKRTAFPRFYFLSSDELLEILSETKDPTRVQKHLRKCFEGMEKLQFDELKKIYGMYSSEGEYVNFLGEIDSMAARGAVELWLIQVEDAMIASIRDVIEKSYDDYLKKKRVDWVLNRCGQSVLADSMTYWTQETEQCIKEKGLAGLREYLVKCENMIEDIVQLVRKDISPLNRLTLEALIVLDVHNKDVIKDLVDAKVSDISDFLWSAQMRYYWEDGNTKVRIINATLRYNYEYLGNSSRLVITPLTDRCYRTLCGAINLDYGGAPEGPAGTGKTETVKDLAKALARQCIVFNCSDGLDYKAMGKFFKGLSSSGAWSCFDEFNRIELEVLSVVAQQIQEIQYAIKAGKTEFFFEGSLIKLKNTANCFITMNPGYAGRSELPDNLKVLFRSVAMMVPDYALIAKISLYSFGFSDAENLARKIVTTYKLCSEQLSSQSHYDYGMRAVKSVLTAAGNLLRKYPNEKENILILRAIKDVNLAKFLSFDIPLFKGITQDLFPGVDLPEIDYTAMFEAINNQCKIMKLKDTEYFKEKIIQLYEMILVRHGLMVVGMPFSGKTSATRVLARALSELNDKKLMGEKKVQIEIVNPKSIEMKMLYGFSDEVTQEWTDGVLALKFKQFATAENDDRKWLIFDGPVDAVWIENMNTVLDDNKKLCLNSGQIIPMTRSMNMMFEPMDLLAASPATVSRCGMIYMEPESMGWRPMFRIWRENNCPKTFKPEDNDEIDYLFETFIDKLLAYHRKNLQESSPTQNQNLIQSLMKIYSTLLEPFNDQNYYNSLEFKSRQTIYANYFLFSVTWSLGGSLLTDSRKPFDQYLKKLINGDVPDCQVKKKLSYPEGLGTCFDVIYKVHQQKPDGEWIQWMDLLGNLQENYGKAAPQDIIVKTTDTVRYSYLLNLFVKNEIHTLFCGPTGTGKSVYTKNVLFNELSKDKYLIIDIAYSAQTKAFQTQDIIDATLTRRKKGYFGPHVGKKCVIFVDDLNMPMKEKWGAQPPIEILRQWLDQGGWYDLKEKEKSFRNIVDCMFVAAMGPPGGGRTFITPRISRHLNLVSFANFDEAVMSQIFRTILGHYLTSNNFNSEVIKLDTKIVLSTIEVYKMALKELKPTPSKSHYLFNLRDFAKVIFGVCMGDKDKISSPDHLIRLWVHEVMRVFGDRLVVDDDKMILFRNLKEICRRVLGANFDNVFATLDINGDGKIELLEEIRRLMFSDIMTASAVKKVYEEILDYGKLQSSIEQSLVSYNINSEKRMDLVLFNFAVEHLVIISRILKQPGGNALLIGVGGSGRQSLTRLAASIMEYEVKQIELSKNYGKVEWRDDIKKLLRDSGGKGVPTVFLFTDSQIKDESFVEDINALLNSGEVPNLFPADEKAAIMELVRAQSRLEGKAPDGTPAQLYAFFIEKVKKLLHIVLCFSPIGDALRNRIRNFPSLVNCCTIDWFSAWPSDALFSVAKRFVSDITMDDKVKDNCVEMLQNFHESTVNWADVFYKQLRRKFYVTPTSYLEMIITFKSLLSEKREEVKASKFKYDNGYEKIITTEKKVEEMQVSLTKLQPQLKTASEETAKKLEEVTVQKAEADKVKAVVSVEEETAAKATEEALSIKELCDEELNKALPALEAAEQALNLLDKKQIDETKTYKVPPVPVKLTLQAVLMLTKKVKVERKPNKNGEYEWQWWEASVKMLNESDFLPYCVKFKDTIDNVEEDTIKKVEVFLKDNAEQLKPEVVKNASAACEALVRWVIGISSFYWVNKNVRPLKEKAAKASAEAEKYKATLAQKQKELKKVVDKVDALTRELNEAEAKKKRLEHEYEDVSKKLVRAKDLIENLGGEKGRWKELGTSLETVYANLTGDILISSGMIAYLGAFTSAYRTKITEEWVKGCQQRAIPGSEHYKLQVVLGDAVKIRSWNIDGLPSDAFSIENAIIISKARRWPLCIDPQGQANKWIKNMEKVRGVKTIKLSDGDYLRTLENSIQFGKPVLLENVPEELDPSLEPILLKQTYKKGSSLYIRLGETVIEYQKEFCFYITTKLRNPHYMPELSTKVTLLNFMITLEGLNDQLLGILVKKERPELEQEKERLILEGANNKKQLQEIEEKILEVLSSGKNILEDETAINILKASKHTSNEITEKQKIAETTEKEIDVARIGYSPVSQEAACLFFAITDLGNIDPMYQYSLVYFIDLFTQSIIRSEQSSNLDTRLRNLRGYFLYSLYSNICRSLFEKDKLLFSFLLSVRLKEFKGELDTEHYRFLLTGGVSLGEKLSEPPATWMSEKSWSEINRLAKLPHYEDLHLNVAEKIKEWQEIYESANPYKLDLPEPFGTNLSKFERLLVFRALRPDKMVPAIQLFVSEELDDRFIDPPPFDLGKIYKDSNSVSPLIFVLSPGSDPSQSLAKFGETLNKKPVMISLGQGRGPIAEKHILEASSSGSWVCLQNCHLAVKWMPTLERICEQFSADKLHPDFRLWLTSYPSPQFPISILQNGVKMTNEAPKGLKANLNRSYMTDPISDRNGFFETSSRPKEFRKLLYGLCFFHAVIQERRKFGPLGWNIPYEFNESDLRISAQQLLQFLNDYPNKVPLEALRYLTAECNYGGRVTDDKDRRLITTLLDDYFCNNIIEDDNYTFSAIEFYKAPRDAGYDEAMDTIKNIPLIVEPEVFGLHANADITKDLGETNLLLDSLLLCQSESGGGDSAGQDDKLSKLVDSILSGFPDQFDLVKTKEKYPFKPKESMNTVLTQELERFNKLIAVIISSLKNIKLAMKGDIIMNSQLERAVRSLLDNKVPEMWMEQSYPSLKPLGGYVKDLRDRITFFQKWVDDDFPMSFWLSGFYFTQSFLTGVLQNYARKKVIAIDEIEFDFEFLKEEPKKRPEDGAYVYGLFVEGAKWNYNTMKLDESDPKVLFVKCPYVLLKPLHRSELSAFPHYHCPVYKTSARRGVLSTTGHSTNFVMWMKLNSDKPQSHWIKRGVALLTQLDD